MGQNFQRNPIVAHAVWEKDKTQIILESGHTHPRLEAINMVNVCAMEKHKHKSPEELRLASYAAKATGDVED